MFTQLSVSPVGSLSPPGSVSSFRWVPSSQQLAAELVFFLRGSKISLQHQEFVMLGLSTSDSESCCVIVSSNQLVSSL